MKKINLLVVLLSIIAFFSGCSEMDVIDNKGITNEEESEVKETPEDKKEESKDLENILPICIETTSGQINTGLYKEYSRYEHFEYDSLNRIIQIRRVSVNDTVSTFISYEDDKIRTESTDTKEPGKKSVAVYSYDGLQVTVEGEPPIQINEKLQVTSYINKNWSGSEFSFTYDEKGNVSTQTFHPWQDERTITNTLKYDNKNGIFRNVKIPSWFLVTQIGGEIAYQNLYNNCIARGEEVRMKNISLVSSHYEEGTAFDGYLCTYNSIDYPVEIARIPVGIIGNSSLSYRISYNNAEYNAPFEYPTPPVEPVVYDLSGNVNWSFGYRDVFIGKAIYSFDPDTREMVFGNILANLNEFAPLQLDILREKELLMSATVIASDKPQVVNDLVFLIKVANHGGFYYPDEYKYYFLDGYPALDELPAADREEAKLIREANAKKRKSGWETFIKYLTETGKVGK